MLLLGLRVSWLVCFHFKLVPMRNGNKTVSFVLPSHDIYFKNKMLTIMSILKQFIIITPIK